MAQINTSQQFEGKVEFFLADGVTPAQVQPGSVVWATSDATAINVIPSDDGMSFVAPAVAPNPGNPARLSVTADADLGAGVVQITGVSDDIDVVQDPAALASVIKISLGAPVPKT